MLYQPGSVSLPHSMADAAESANEVTFAAEYQTHFRARSYTMAGSELSPKSATRLLSLLQLSSSDRFIDLGSSTGRLTLAAAVLTPVSSVLGVELSPTRHVQAVEALKRLGSVDSGDWKNARVSHQQGDLLEADLENASVIWCAVQARSGRKIGTALVENIRRGLQQGATARLFLAGFQLPKTVVGATLQSAYVFGVSKQEPHKLSAAAHPTDMALLYGRGKNGGPVIVLEYNVAAVDAG